jgi:hypothetical protein
MPATISYLDDDLLIDGVSTASVTQGLLKSGLAPAVTAQVIGWWYMGAIGASRPPAFDFATDVQATDAACAVDYARQFTHVDWIDGESRVQAGATPEELGVNARFHAIEAEFDAIAAQFARLGTCVGDIRSDLVGVVRELESKITALQNELYDLRQDDDGAGSGGGLDLGIIGTTIVDGDEVFISRVGDQMRLIQFAGSTIGTPTKKDLVVHPPKTITTMEPDEVLVVLGEVEEIAVLPAFTELYGRPGGTTVGELRALGSTVVLPSGVSLGAVLATLPAETKIADAPALVAAVSTQLAGEVPAERVGALRTQVIVDATARDRTGSALLNTGVAALGVTGAVADALAGAGLGTVGSLSQLTASEVTARLGAAGVAVDAATVRTAVTRAQVARGLRGRVG